MIELGTLLDAWLIDNELDTESHDLDFIGYEYCSGNGQYVNYKKLWDEEAEQQEKELKKFESWKENVAKW